MRIYVKLNKKAYITYICYVHAYLVFLGICGGFEDDEMFVLDEEVWRLEELLPAGLVQPDLLAGGQADFELLLHYLEGGV